MIVKRLSILLSMMSLSAAWTPAPDMLWQTDPLHHAADLGFWDVPQQAPMLTQLPVPSIASQQALLQTPHISYDQLYRLMHPGAAGSGISKPGGNGSAPLQTNTPSKTNVSGNGMASFLQLMPFLQLQQKQTTIATTTTTRTTPKPTTTTATTTTTTQKATTTTSKPTTWSPKLKLSEILILQAIKAGRNGGKEKPTTPRTKGCFFKNKWYQPLTQIERGQVGDWCWGSYCNHENKVIHWDDHKCAIPTGPPTPPTTTQDPNQYGCFYHGSWYAPGADIENYREYGRCFGTYCDYNSRVQEWQDRCLATVAPPTGSLYGMGSGSGLGGMGAGPLGGLPGLSELGGLGGGGGGSGMNIMSLLSKKKR